MPDLSSPWVWALAVAAAFCVGMSKTGLGGLGIVSVSLFAMIFPAKESTGALLPLADAFRGARWLCSIRRRAMRSDA